MLTNTPSPMTAPGRAARLFALLLLPLAAACEFPTEAPQISQKWVVPIDSTALVVDSVLPSQIRTSGSNFQLTLPAIPSVSRTYAQLCGAGCPTGANVAKPAFNAVITTSTAVDPLVLSTNAVSGSVTLSLTHNFSFDPLRPSASARGYIVTQLKNGAGVVIGKDSVNGAQTAWTSAAALQRTVTVNAGASLVGTITVEVTLNSPAGDPATISGTQAVTVAVNAPPLVVNTVRVAINSRSTGTQNTTLKTSDISTDFVDHIQSGSLLTTFSNPFGITGTIATQMQTPTGLISKSVTLNGSATQTVQIDYTQDELKRILGQDNVTLKLAGTVSGPAGGVSVSPGQALVMKNSLAVTILLGN